MTPERWQRIQGLFEAALPLESDQRSAFLEDACAGDSELRAQVDDLLAHVRQEGSEDAAVRKARNFLGLPMDLPTEPAAIPSGAPGRRIGSYTLLRELGHGGMGVVYEARQDNPDRRVALKIVHSRIASPDALRRFELEAHVLGRLHHPGIAQIYEAGIGHLNGDAPVPFFAMELLRGKPLTEYANERRLGLRARLELMANVCDAVHHAHQKGVIHRDLKPRNILVVEPDPVPTAATSLTSDADCGDSSEQWLLTPAAQPHPKVLDFGVARVTDSDLDSTRKTDVGALIGTLPYMSPEQVSGDPDVLDTRSDIYALGVVLYELLTGRLPYDLRNCSTPAAIQLIREHEPTRLSKAARGRDLAKPHSVAGSGADAPSSGPPPLDGFPTRQLRGDVETIVAKALEKDKARRYQAASALAADLRRFLGNEPIAARPTSTWYHAKKFARRHPGLVAGVATTIVVLVGGLIATELSRQRALVAEGHQRRLQQETARLLADSLAQSARIAAQRGDWGASLRSCDDALKLGHSDEIRLRLGSVSKQQTQIPRDHCQL